jgi:glycosyltransferase involved in cell wall biosynthesis
MYTFLGNLRAWLDAQGIPYTTSLDDHFDVLFANSWMVPVAAVKRARQRLPDARVVHRVDGAAVDYGSSAINDRVQARVNLFADLTIFQSEYSRFSTTTKFRVVTQDGPVIYNPVDVERFSPEGPRRQLPEGPRVACASWSINRKKGTWQIDELARAHPGVHFVLCGRFEGVCATTNVHLLGHLDREGIARALRSCDVFLNLSENDPCPNVVLEALASGLPVIYKDSGGVGELVADCGVVLSALDRFPDALEQVMANRASLTVAARERAVERFAPQVIFPQYLDALRTPRRRAVPSTIEVIALAGRGYPVLPAAGPVEAVRSVVRKSAAVLRQIGASRPPGPQIGWITYDSFPERKWRFAQLDSFTGMRVGNVASWLNEHGHGHHELYRRARRYDVVVFQKMMDERCQAEMRKIRAYGGKVVFDANVNYYEVWGDYFVPGTKPTAEQQRDAQVMTSEADWVVADSSYLEQVIRRFTPRVTWIPDNVDVALYAGTRAHAATSPVRLVWSGVGKKAAHLLAIRDVLASVTGIELVVVTDEEPDFMHALRGAVPCRLVKFSDQAYAQTLRSCDIIISPKRLVNAYELAHTEYKITLGMAMGLPAVASPQQSYVEAIGHHGGGLLASTDAEWRDALTRLVTQPAERANLGLRAQRTVLEHYATPVVAARYDDVLQRLVAPAGHVAASARPA